MYLSENSCKIISLHCVGNEPATLKPNSYNLLIWRPVRVSSIQTHFSWNTGTIRVKSQFHYGFNTLYLSCLKTSTSNHEETFPDPLLVRMQFSWISFIFSLLSVFSIAIHLWVQPLYVPVPNYKRKLLLGRLY